MTLSPASHARHLLIGEGLSIAKQVMSIEQAPGDLRPFFKASADRGGDSGSGLAAHAGQLGDLDDDAAHAAYFIEARGNVQTDAQLFVHAPLHVLKVGQTGDVFQAIEQTFFLLSCQAEDALIGGGALQQAFAVTDASAGRAG